MDGESSLIYSYTEGSIIAAKVKHKEENIDYIRMGISFPLDKEKYKSTFHPTEDYVAYEVLNPLLELSDIVDKDRKYKIRKTSVCYGNSLSMLDKRKGKATKGMFVMNEPLKESSDVTLGELANICDSLAQKHQEVSFYRESGVYLAAGINYNPMSKKFGSLLNLLDIKIPKVSLGCRLEFVLPEELYGVDRIEQPFNDVAHFIGFGTKLSQLEKMHKEFLELKDSCRTRPKVVMKVKV